MNFESLSKQTTDDGSITFWNSKFGESYHSKHGAYREALEKHVEACQVKELASKQNEIKILDVCFGLGYNSFVAIKEVLLINPQIKIEIIALENDPEIVEKISEIEYGDNLKNIVKDFVDNNSCIKLAFGDARDTIKDLSSNFFDAIFFDPFSPKVCPELWTEEFINDVISKAKPGAYISTYSCARIVKDNFAKAGCKILEGPKCGRRTGGVLGLKL